MKFKVNLIVAACENMGIGINGDLPWRLKNELKYFSSTTTKVLDANKQNAVIMGRKSYFGIPESKRPLKNRINFVLTRNPEAFHYPKDVIVCSSLQQAIAKITDSPLAEKIETIWIVGGSSVYKEAMELDFCHRLYFTEIKSNFECDTFFPDISDDFKLINDNNIPNEIQEENGIKYQYKIYEKIH